MAKREQTVFFDPKKPEASTLQKRFPVKKTFYSLITLGLFAYFLILRKRVQKYI